MLQSDLKYVCLDFETTGLDREKDEAIQVGIVVFDHTGKIIDSFSSYIKPEKSLNELKDMVRVVTGLNINALLDAPRFEEIATKVASFFDEKTVIIGHNVQFDIRFLERFTDAQYLASIDTFPLAQSLMPFAASYALEVLEKSLPVNPQVDTLPLAATSHDALYDAYGTYKVFQECIKRITNMIAKYPELELYLSRGECALSTMWSKNANTINLGGALPILSKTVQAEKKLVSGIVLEKTDLAEKANYYIGNTPLKEVLKKLPKENVIYAFSQRHKTMIAKNILHEIGLTHIDIGNAYTFDKEMLALFARKLSYEQGELYFMLKYFFHAFSGHSTIDLNNSYDRKIYHALKEVKTSSAAKSVDIMTHEQLYDKLAEQDIMPYTSIFFFDQDRRYDSHIKREQKPFDLYYLLQVTDSYIYKDSLLTPGKESLWLPLHTQLVIFLGIRQTEVAGLLKDVSNTSVEMDNGVIGNTYFYKTSLLISQINETFAALSGRVNDNDYTIMHDKRKKFISIISTSCGINTKLQGEEVHFLVKKLHTYLDYSEFQQIFDIHQTIFLSAMKKDRPTLGSLPPLTNIPQIAPRPGKEKLSYENKNIYVFSNNKQTSQDLLVWLHSHKPEKHKVHGENITGGKGKNIFAIKGSEYNIIIGGYDFFLQCIAQKVSIDKIYTLCINGPLEHLISGDLSYYGSTTL